MDLTMLMDHFPKHSLPRTYSFPLIGSLACELLNRGFRVSLFATSTDISKSVSFIGTSGVEIHVIPQRTRRAAYDFYRHERKMMAEQMRRANCDVVHAHWTYEFAAAALDANQNCIVTAHDAPQAILRYFVATRFFPFWFAKFLLGAIVIKKARSITAVSPYCAESVKKLFSPTTPIAIIPNGIEERYLHVGRSRLLCPRVKSSRPRVAMVLQGFQKRKNPQTALRAFAMLRHHFPRAELHLMGSGYGEGEEAQAWAMKAGLCQGVVFKGKVPHEHLMKFLGTEVDVLLHPALEESFGMAPLEAMAVGVPVVGGQRSGGVPYVLDNGKAGVLTDVNQPRWIARAIERLLIEDAYRERLIEAAWLRAREHFSFGTMVDRYVALYKTRLESRIL